MLGRFGIGGIWRRWIKGCLNSTHFSVLVNGISTEKFKSSHGLWQGDPLSPFLFLLVAEILAKMLEKAKDEGLISGFQVSSNGESITHLQFADDTLLFVDASLEEVQQLKIILLCFEAITGMKVNLSKSSLMVISKYWQGVRKPSCRDIVLCLWGASFLLSRLAPVLKLVKLKFGIRFWRNLKRD